MAVAYQTIKGSSGLYIPVGMIMPWSKGTTPSGFLVCDGSAISRVDYAALFEAIGTTHGVGDGSTTFNVPDLRGRLPVGDDNGVTYTVADTGGSASVTPTVNKSGSASGSLNGAPDAGNLAVSVSGNVNVANTTLTNSTIPSHTHPYRDGHPYQGVESQTGLQSGNYRANYASGGNTPSLNTQSTGSGGAHGHTGGHNLSGSMTGAPGLGTLGVTINDNIAVSADAIDTRSPYLALRYVIKF